MINKLLDYIFEKYGKHDIEYTYYGSGSWDEKRIWILEIFNKTFVRYYDK